MRVIEILCSHPHCARKDEHSQICDGGECAGCQPWPAADGLRLCQHHADRLAGDLDAIPDLWAALDDASLGGSGTGQPTVSGGTVDPPMPINPTVVELQQQIRAGLVEWALLISRERGMDTPPDNVPAIAQHVARSAPWLAAHPAAPEACTAMSDLVAAARRITQPSGTRAWTIGPCPEDGCSGTIAAVMRIDGAKLPSELACDTSPDHVWKPPQWSALGERIAAAADPTMVDTAALAEALDVKPQRVRYLASLGVLTAQRRRVIGHTGRPAMIFNLAASLVAYAAYSVSPLLSRS